MRWMRSFIFILVLLPIDLAAQQYSEAVCMLLQQQIDRYANQKNHPNYRSARREYDKYCYKETPRRQMPVEVEPTVSEKPQPRLEYKRAARPGVTEPQEQKQPETPPVAANSDALAEGETKTVADDSAEPQNTAPLEAVTRQNNDSTLRPADNAAEQTDNQRAEVDTTDHSLVAADSVEENVDTTRNKTPDTALAATALEPKHSESGYVDTLLIDILSVTPLIAANVVAFLLVIFLLTNWLGLNLPGFKGVFAEYKLNRLLRWRLSKEYLHFRKLRLTNDNNETVVIDHLVLSPFGIFIIMVKGYRGRIAGSESQANWTRDYLGNSKQFMNPLHQNFKNMQALQQLLELPGFELMHSVIAFARVGQFASELPANITYIDTTSNYIKQCTERCINDEQLARFSAVIQQVVNDA